MNKRSREYISNIYTSSDDDIDDVIIPKNKPKNDNNYSHNDGHNDELDLKCLLKYSKSEREKYKQEYDNIKKHIRQIPTVFDILETKCDFKEKCALIEQLDILINMEQYSKEYVVYKNNLIDEIDKLKAGNSELEKELLHMIKADESLKERILTSDIKKEQKAIIYDKYLKMQKLDTSNPEYHKLSEWIEYSLNIPTSAKTINLPSIEDGADVISNRLFEIQQLLDENLYGMDNVKEEILLILNNKISNVNNTNNAMALLGPPGTGKTSIIRTLATALNIPFYQISLGGTTDASYLDGHSYTYEGACPGIIAKAIMQMKCTNGILFFDEIDKLSESEKGKEVAWNLLHITDFSQNNDFRDKYLCDISIDLSKLWFVYSMNDDNLMDNALKDRIPIINVNGYGNDDKITICKKHLIPNILKNINLNANNVIFDDGALRHLVGLDNNVPGVRKLQKLLSNILSKINLYKNTMTSKKQKTKKLKLSFDIKNFKLPLKITADLIDQLCGN